MSSVFKYGYLKFLASTCYKVRQRFSGRPLNEKHGSLGYTLIELLIVMSIVGLVFGLGYASYRQFARNQALLGVGRVIVGDLRLAQEEALAGKKPGGCVTLQGYQFNRTSATSYTIEAVCSDANYPLKTVSGIFTDTTMSTPFPNPILFKVLGKGTNIAEGSSATIFLTGVGVADSVVVSVTSGGEIKEAVLTGSPSPSPTPSPTPPATPTPTPTATPTSSPTPTPGGDPWWNVAWSYRKKLTIDSTKVSGTSNLSSFPVLVSRTDADLSSKAQADGDDIVFTDKNATKLDHEIENYVSGTGELIAWVRIPTLSYNTDTEIYMYYGNAGAANQQNVAGTWDANYLAVFHLDEDAAGTGTADLYQDSTSNANHGDDFVSATGQSGQIDGGQVFDGADDYIDLGTTFPGLGSAFSIEGWFWFNNFSGNPNPLVRWKWSNSDWRVGANTSGNASCQISYDGTEPADATANGPSSLVANTWYYFACLKTTSNLTFYINTSPGTTVTTSGTVNNNTSIPARMGSRADGSQDLNGRSDEVRVSSVARTLGWITTSYNNQNSPSTFVTAGTEEIGLAGGSFLAQVWQQVMLGLKQAMQQVLGITTQVPQDR